MRVQYSVRELTTDSEQAIGVQAERGHIRAGKVRENSTIDPEESIM